MKTLYRFFWDCGRLGDVEGVFVAESDEVKKYIGKEVYFGEILGKHSEIFGDLEKEDLQVLTKDQDFIEKLIKIFKSDTISGYNPIERLKEDEYL